MLATATVFLMVLLLALNLVPRFNYNNGARSDNNDYNVEMKEEEEALPPATICDNGSPPSELSKMTMKSEEEEEEE